MVAIQKDQIVRSVLANLLANYRNIPDIPLPALRAYVRRVMRQTGEKTFQQNRLLRLPKLRQHRLYKSKSAASIDIVQFCGEYIDRKVRVNADKAAFGPFCQSNHPGTDPDVGSYL